MIRWVMFQLHWFLGISAGLVLAVMGVTGATMSFEDELIAALSPGIVTVSVPADAVRLSPDALIAKAVAQRAGHHVLRLSIPTDGAHAPRVTFDSDKAQQRRGERSYINPYTGQLLGQAHGDAFFATVRRVHRYLALPDDGNGVGRIITGISALALIYFALSGLYLRWPRQPLNWRSWVVLDLRHPGRQLYRNLHTVIGTWMLAFYLLSALTGMWWSYNWYRTGLTYALTGQAPPRERPTPTPSTSTIISVPLASAWRAFEHATDDRYAEVTVFIPTGDAPIRFRALLAGARHDRMVDDIEVSVDGHVLTVDRYADRPMGEVLTSSMLALHQGSFFGLPGRIVMALTSLSMPLFAITGLLLYLDRRRRKRVLRPLPAPITPHPTAGEPLLIVYASQTGRARQLAQWSAQAFEQAGQPTQLISLARVDAARLANTTRLLCVVSTHGEGEPPDEARAFDRRVLGSALELKHLRYAVLALGERHYATFCKFGRRLDHWLQDQGAQPLFARIECDGDDEADQLRWNHALARLGAHSIDAALHTPAFQHWQLVDRRLLNPGSPGAPAFHIVLQPPEAPAGQHQPVTWEAGDIVDIEPRQPADRIAAWLRTEHAYETGLSPTALHEQLAVTELPVEPKTFTPLDQLSRLRPREYSIASIPASGRIELLVRETRSVDGELGLASGWLCRHAAKGSAIRLRIRPNPGFHAPPLSAPLILIGNGTGIAGLLAHLRHRHASGGGSNWLLFGERTLLHDAFHAQELDGYFAQDTSSRCDRIFSREPNGGYVQELLHAHGDALQHWVDLGASILVCGSLQGMAPAVDRVLRHWLGSDFVDSMITDGRYRRDVY